MKRDEILAAARRADLARSGLDKSNIVKKMRLGEPISWQKTEELTGISSRRCKAMAYEIPYFDVSGRPLHYSRWKLIALEGELPFKYFQEERTIPHLYLPPLTDWSRIVSDPSIRIVITEGEKKAACATLHGLPTIGVGGVWNWKSRKWGMEELSDLDWFRCDGREVEICYDGDMYTNENVHRARDALVSALAKRGARVFVRYLPNTEGRSALDDFLVAFGVERYQKLQCEEASTSRELQLLNEKVAYVEDVNIFVSIEDGAKLRSEKELDRRFGTISLVSEKGTKISATKFWVSWPHRRTLRSITFAPGEGRIYRGMYNEWKGWGVEPRRGEVGQFLEVIKSIDRWDWFLQWLAYPLQYPGTKLTQAVVIWSVRHGTGKSFIGEVMRDIYGRGSNSSVISSADLHGSYNGWIANKQFVMGEEVSDFAGRADYNLLKSYVTGESIMVKEKYVPAYELPNRANFYFTSNHPNPVKVDRNDRRFFVATLDVERPRKFWDKLDRWRWKEGGPAAFMWYLQNKVDTSKFDPMSRPPDTEAKAEMIVDSMTAMEQWCYMLVQDPDGTIAASLGDASQLAEGQDVFTVGQIIAWMPEEMQRKTDASVVGRVLVNAGVAKAGPVKVRERSGTIRNVRLMAIRNIDEWRARPASQWAANYAGELVLVRKRSAER